MILNKLKIALVASSFLFTVSASNAQAVVYDPGPGPLGGSGQMMWDWGNHPTIISQVPEAEEWAMMLLGLGVIGFVARRKK